MSTGGCPPTLLLHGEHDILVPVNTVRELYARLTAAGVPVAMHLFSQTDHAFDLILPKISPRPMAPIMRWSAF
ncbi:MAG: prolyl oligopeptidase family serine peptidase [Saprospirales bacterium]|nr:prolyl oligopeptidase family serine peptidase [Saprospirales bacterium]